MSVPALAGLAEELSSQFVVLTRLGDGSSQDGEQRRLVKFSYEEPAASYEPAERSFKHKMSALAYRAGLWPEKRILDAVPVGTAHSYQSKSRRPTASKSSVPLFSPKTRSS